MATKYRYDLDGLRGIAIAFVVLFHVFVGKVSGGVDVFLVLSGYFFAGSQLRYAARPDASANPWWSVWRTLRRLVPTLVLVLGATTLAVRTWAPSLGDSNYYRQLTASLLYYQNWELAGQGQEYGAASATASPLQHIWSMSVQGQFYLAIILVTSALVLLRRRGIGSRLAGPVLVVVTVVSFAYAWYLHRGDQALNHYSTFSRMWELTGGACLALYAPAWRERLNQTAHAWAAGIGLAMVLSTGVLLDGASAFPGPATLYPVVGTALLIVGGGPVAQALASRFPRWLGQIAYPLYMWHWPLLIVGTSISGQESPSILLGCAVVGASLVLADLTHRLVERPLQQKVRRPNREENRFATGWTQLRTSAAAQVRAGAGVVVLGLCALVLAAPAAHTHRVEALSDDDFDPTFYPGARALTENAYVPEMPNRPDPYLLADSYSLAWEDGCFSTFADPANVLPQDLHTDRDCTYGDPDGDLTVVLLGGSHAEQWMDPLDQLGREEGFQLIPIARQSCPAFAQDVDGIWADDCHMFNQAALDAVMDIQPDIVISTSTRPLLEKGQYMDSVPESYPTLWSLLDASGITFIGLRDNPWFTNADGSGKLVSQCHAENEGTDGVLDCGVDRALFYGPDGRPDPAKKYERRYKNMHTIDTSDWFCDATFCPAAIGNIYVYRDGNHISRPYAMSLIPELRKHIAPILAGVRDNQPAEPVAEPGFQNSWAEYPNE